MEDVIRSIENRLAAIENQSARHRYLNIALILTMTGFVMVEVLARRSQASPPLEPFRLSNAVFVTVAMAGATVLALIRNKPFESPWDAAQLVAGLAFAVGLIGATATYLYRNAYLTDWLAGRLALIFVGVLIGFALSTARKAQQGRT